MYLKRLEISGFKSFANKTVLDFTPPAGGRFSITAIVGPNGAGKSNISDAIRWVMGETSMKQLRGKKGEDVIFNGSSTKGQLGAAEVTLILDNSDLPHRQAGSRVMSDYPEIAITRRLYRSGEGEYLINNSPARLFDIHLLLAKAQFAEHSYSVVGQGMIDRLLTVSTAERKDFLDEASGIKEFQIKQHQAQLKLWRTAENMAQAERLVAEVEPHLRLLSRQVKKLERRQEVELQLRETEEKYYATLSTRNQTEINRLNKDLSGAEKEYREGFKDLEVIQNELATLARSASRQEVFASLQTKHQEAVHAKNELERELAVLQGQMQTEYSAAGKQNISWLEKKISELKFNRDQIAGELLAAEAEAGRVNQTVLSEKNQLEAMAMAKAEKTVRISQLQSQLFKDQSEQNYLQFSGLSAVKAVLEERHNLGKVYGLVAELGEVDEEHRLALEVAAAAHLSSVVVENEEVAKKAIVHLREQRLGVATFLPLSKIRARENNLDESLLTSDGVIGVATDLIKYDKKFSEIFSFVLGNTLVVKDLTSAQRLGIGRCRMVTLAGDLIEKTGVMKGGWRQKRQGTPGFSAKVFFTGEDRLKEYQAQIELEQQNILRLEKEAENVKSKTINLEVAVKIALAKVELLRVQSQNVVRETANLEKELSLAASTPEEYGAQLQELGVNKEKLIKNIAASASKIKELAEAIEGFNRKEEEKKQRVFNLQEEMQKKQTALNIVLNKRNDLKIELAKLETKQEDLAEEVLSNMNVSLASIMERGPAIVEIEQLEEVAGQIQKLKYQLSLIGGIDEDVTKEYEETKERFDFLATQLEDLKKATEDLNKMIAELDELMKKKRETAFRKIRKEFDRYFKILFNGGHAELEEIYGPEPEPQSGSVQGEPQTGEGMSPSSQEGAGGVAEAEAQPSKKEKILTGIEIMANPPGKKIKHLSALSGGERTLTSIALICAILNCNPSPFVVLDEVEAALDEANTMRFADIMSELSRQSQFIIITHNRVTMHSADALYGVVMGGDGISKLLSVKIEDVPQYEDKTPVRVDKDA